ncbi:MAG: cryptochrome/photolyase family protein [Pseudomonadota bacterium]
MKTLRFVLGDQLDRQIASLADLDPKTDVVFGCEVMEEATYVRHHQQKIAFLFAAMRHFFAGLENEGITVDYRRYGRHDTFLDALKAAAKKHKPDRIVVTEPGEWRVLEAMRGFSNALGVPVEIRDDDRFFADHATFRRFAEGRKELRMEYFYRELRRETGILMEDGDPVGGQWNFDKENRKALPKGFAAPDVPRFEPDKTTAEVLNLTAKHFGNHFGRLDKFNWPVTRADALKALDDFIENRLPSFGDYQDAMATGEPFLNHSLISPLINAGLLRPREVCARAEAAYRDGSAPLNAVEGFVRQILGWREFIRGVYWLKMPDYVTSNALDAQRPLPDFFWTADTDLHCLAEAIGQTRDHAYAHHIQRLMVTGNFALLAGIRPEEIEEWYLIVYADAYDWVELPNVHGMATFADGGVFASKPYAASGSYINKMSNYCKSCRYDVRQKDGEDACPFNYLYWNFIIENASTLRKNARMGMVYRTLDKMSDERKRAATASAAAFFESALPSP